MTRLRPKHSAEIRRRAKHEAELGFWRWMKDVEGTLDGDHYAWFYTREFGLTAEDYIGKRVLDIGCGPCGSLEWAEGAEERVGLDPLVDKYRDLGINEHAMTYVSGGVESIPFPDGHFDIVAAFNSLDHVDDIDAAIGEMTRVTKRGGIAVVIVEVNHGPTPTEPLTLPWNLFDRFEGWTVEMEKRTAMRKDDGLYDSYREAAPWVAGSGLLGGRLRRT